MLYFLLGLIIAFIAGLWCAIQRLSTHLFNASVEIGALIRDNQMYLKSNRAVLDEIHSMQESIKNTEADTAPAFPDKFETLKFQLKPKKKGTSNE